jgi:hypothetical protein
MLHAGQCMKLMYFSSDVQEVELLKKEFIDAGIPCELRVGSAANGAPATTACAELWIEHSRDTHRALMLCVELGIGFAKRARKRPGLDDGTTLGEHGGPTQ